MKAYCSTNCKDQAIKIKVVFFKHEISSSYERWMSPLYSTQNRSHIREQHEDEWTMTEFSFMPELFLEMINQNVMNCLKDSDKTKTQALHVLARPVKQKHNVRIGSSDIKQILYVSFPLPQKRQICLCLKSCILLLFLRILFRKYKSTSSFLLPPFFPRPVFFFFFFPFSFSATHKSTQENNKHEMDGNGSQVWVERQRHSGELVPRLWEERRGQAITWLLESQTGNQKNWLGLTVIRHPSSITSPPPLITTREHMICTSLSTHWAAKHTHHSILTFQDVWRAWRQQNLKFTHINTHTKAQPQLWNRQVCLLNNISELYAHPWAITVAVYALTCSGTVE